jgi:integrase
VNGWLRVLKTLLADACADLGINLNPAARVRALPTGPREADNCLSGSELQEVLEAMKEHESDWYPLFATLAMTGMRFGEATALRWEDLSDDCITIRRAQCRGVVGKTKTGKTRVVPLLPELSTILGDHRKALLATKAPGFDSGYIFPSKNGKLLYGPSARKPLQRALTKAKISRRFSPHGFRHTFNNLVRQQASGEVVRAMTGHSTERMTEHYSHVHLDEKKAAAGRALGSLFPASHDESGSSGGSRESQTKKPATG